MILVRYANTDYVLASALSTTRVSTVLVSYDISCQWLQNLQTHLQQLPDLIRTNIMHLVGNGRIDTAIPKFHLPSHKAECHSRYSLNYCLGAGRTDGEAPERIWGATNRVANSTKEMKEGHRHDTLNNVINDINWQKTSCLGEFT